MGPSGSLLKASDSTSGASTMKDHPKIMDAEEFRLASMRHKKHLVLSEKAIARSRKLILFTKERLEHFRKKKETERPRRVDIAA